MAAAPLCLILAPPLRPAPPRLCETPPPSPPLAGPLPRSWVQEAHAQILPLRQARPASLWLCSYRRTRSRGVHEMADHRRPPRPLYSAPLCHVIRPARPIRGGAGRDVRAIDAARNRGCGERAPGRSVRWVGCARRRARPRGSGRRGSRLGHSHEPRRPPPPPLFLHFRLDCRCGKLPALLRHCSRASAAAAAGSGRSDARMFASWLSGIPVLQRLASQTH